METRQFPRKPFTGKVVIDIDAATQNQLNVIKKGIEGTALDISVMGMGLTSRNFFPVGAVLRLRFVFPPSPTHKEEIPLELRGEVRSAVSAGRGLVRLGIRFINISPEQQQLISNYMATA